MTVAEGGGIFVSYRRQETRHLAGRLADRLADRFGEGQVFIDVDTIEPGVDFTEEILRAVSACKVLLAIIGRDWLTATDERSGRRLDDPDDIVRLEIEAALARGVRVIPILVEGAAMPGRQDLPENLAGLARRNALLIRHESFRSDTGRLVTAIERILAPASGTAAVPSTPAAHGVRSAGNFVGEAAHAGSGPARNKLGQDARLFTGASGGDRALPEPDPAEVRFPAAARAADYAAGDILDGRFEILQVLGQGGFSKVYRVRDDVEGEERALKLFNTAAGYEAVRREIATLRKIHHPNVVEVFWAGETSAGDWYLITEFIDGQSLDEFVTGRRRLRDREAVDVALELLDALVAFHPDAARLRQLDAKRREGGLSDAESREWTELNDKGLIHRDIKPLNVMLTRTGAKLLDFNVASRVGDPLHTQSGRPPYQPPDAGLTRWDVSTDLFAVGVLLYQLLCDGQHPFPNARPIAYEPVTDPRTIRPDLAPGLAEFLVKACAPASADRFSTAADMQHALRNIRADL
jgi:hypothetical protein